MLISWRQGVQFAAATTPQPRAARHSRTWIVVARDELQANDQADCSRGCDRVRVISADKEVLYEVLHDTLLGSERSSPRAQKHHRAHSTDIVLCVCTACTNPMVTGPRAPPAFNTDLRRMSVRLLGSLRQSNTNPRRVPVQFSEFPQYLNTTNQRWSQVTNTEPKCIFRGGRMTARKRRSVEILRLWPSKALNRASPMR